MSARRAAMTGEQAGAWLDEQWRAALDGDMNASDPEVDRLVDSGVLSIRYAVLTQLLGKVADASRDLLCLQRGDAADAEESGRWDPRSFCTGVVVPLKGYRRVATRYDKLDALYLSFILFAHIHDATRSVNRPKARNSGLANIVLAAPGVRQQDRDAVRSRLADEWARGTNVYRISIPELVRGAFVLLEEGWRVRFVKAVGAELDERGAEYPHRRDWSDLLADA